MRHEVMFVKYTKQDFVSTTNGIIEVDETFAIEENECLLESQVKEVPDVHVQGTLQYDGNNRVYSNLEIEGMMIVPDSISLEDIEWEFETTSQTTYSFQSLNEDDEEEIIVVKKNCLDIKPELFQAILLEAPISITHVDRENYPQGDGWQVLSDCDKPEKDSIDPRWEKLNELLKDEKD